MREDNSCKPFVIVKSLNAELFNYGLTIKRTKTTNEVSTRVVVAFLK